jgi:Ni/Co efflux regulator RcnB
MKKIALLALAAGAALIPMAANAQSRHGGGTGVQVRHGGGHNVSVRHGGGNVVVRHGGRGHHPGRNFHHRRLQRGFAIHPFWFGPQFHIQNWQMYGFAAPPRDHRWVRYYDDAYLIDGAGRVRDHRYGLDWDEYGERWEMDEGIPSYYGRGDYRPDEEDYEWAERHGGGADGGGWDYGAYNHGGGYGPAPGPMPACPMPQPCSGHGGSYGHGGAYGYGGGYGAGYGAGYGYSGYGVAYPIIIETTVVTGGTSYEEVIEEEVVEVQQRRRHYRPPPRRSPPRRSPPRRPPPGERG